MTVQTGPPEDAPLPTRVQEVAVIEEASKKSGLLWLRGGQYGGQGRAQAVWHLWHEGAAYVLCGGEEQPALDLDTGTRVAVSVRSKDNGARLVVWEAETERVAPGSELWQAVIPLLAAKRLNAPDGPAAAQRWARSSEVYRLVPTGVLLESWRDPDRRSGAATPSPTPAANHVRTPYVLGGRRRPG